MHVFYSVNTYNLCRQSLCSHWMQEHWFRDCSLKAAISAKASSGDSLDRESDVSGLGEQDDLNETSDEGAELLTDCFITDKKAGISELTIQAQFQKSWDNL